jgi:hypothetical protein
MVSSWASNNNIALGQVKVSEKSNEITAIPELIANLAIQGSIITIGNVPVIELFFNHFTNSLNPDLSFETSKRGMKSFDKSPFIIPKHIDKLAFDTSMPNACFKTVSFIIIHL